MKTLSEEQLSGSPIEQLREWYADAESEKSITYPDAMCLSTISDSGYPDSRMVLLKEIRDEGLVFYTNSNSVKGQALKSTPKAALNFYWMPLDRQVRVQGDVEPISDADSDAYFASRKRGSQIGAWASLQSQELRTRAEFEASIEKLEKEYDGVEIPRPPHWHGFLLKPIKFHFWLQRDCRLHDSFRYTKEDDSRWRISRLYP